MKNNKKNINDKIEIKKINKKRLIALLGLMCLFITLVIMVFTNFTGNLDLAVDSFIMNIRNDKFTNFMINITNVGGAYSLLAITLLLFVILKNKRYAFMIFINLILVFLGSQLFKIILRRPRPDGIFLVPASGFSFPSGHTMVIFGYVGLIIYYIYKCIKNSFLKIFLILFLSILSLTIAFSRIYLGVHYFTDIIGGIILAFIYLIIFIPIFSKMGESK